MASIRMMTFNLRVNVASDKDNAWPNRTAFAAKTIVDAEADIVGTQEGTFAMLEELHALLPDYRYVGVGREGDRAGEFSAIFYRNDRVTLLETEHFWLSEAPDVPGSKSWDSSLPRMCTRVDFQIQGTGETLTVFNTHLDHIGVEARTHGAMEIIRRVVAARERTGNPVFVTGDMNAGPSERCIEIFSGQVSFEALTSPLVSIYETSTFPHRPIPGTFHGFSGTAGREPIDYIFVTPDVVVNEVLLLTHAYDGRFPSDHFPVLASVSVDKV